MAGACSPAGPGARRPALSPMRTVSRRRGRHGGRLFLLLGSLLLLLGGAAPSGAQTTCTATSTAVSGFTGTLDDLVTDCTTLLGLKDTLRGTGSLNWAEGIAMSSWDGITVSGTTPRVTTLNMSDRSLTGTIPAELGALTGLTQLYLYDNQLSGAIPAELGNLTNLTELRLDNNRHARYPNVVLSGPVPASFTALTSLTEFHVQHSRVTVPSALATWAAGRTVTTGTATHSGTIPLAAANTTPVGVWVNTTTLYVSDPGADKVFAYTRADGTPDSTKDITLATGNEAARGLWSDGTTLWVADDEDQKLYAYTLADGMPDSTRDITLAAANPRALWSDGTTLWVVDASGNVDAYTLADGMRDLAKDFPASGLTAANGAPWGLGTEQRFRLARVWVTDAEDLRLYAYNLDNGSYLAARDQVLDPANTAPRGLSVVGSTWYVADAEDAVLYVYGWNPAGSNRSPEAVGTLPDMTLGVENIVVIDPRVAFRDPDGDALTYTAAPEAGPFAEVFIHRTRSEVWIRPRKVGTETATVTATDPRGRSATQEFTVTVVAGPLANQGPLAVGALPDVELALEGAAYPVAITAEFVDPDDEDMDGFGSGHRLTYGAASSNTAVATVSVREIRVGEPQLGTKRAEVSVVPVGVGTTTVTVTATDASGSNTTASQSFMVTVSTLTASGRANTPPTTSVPPSGGGGGGGSGITAEAPDLIGLLENPGAAAFQSGLGLISGWVCEAEAVEIAIGALGRQAAAYGTERPDTAGECGDTDNGFGLLFNWNRLGDGEHEVVAYVDDEELGRATVTVTTLGEEFVQGVAGMCTVADFPTAGETVPVVWQQSQQNFVIADGEAPRGPTRAGVSGVGYLENPGPNSFQSGIGVISGWVCAGEEVVIELGHLGRQVAASGTERPDTLEVCGDTDNGFGLLFNWNRLGDGEHAVVASVDGVELGRATVRVTTLGEEFLRGAAGECVVEGFPMAGETVTLEWQQTSQNFVITDIE